MNSLTQASLHNSIQKFTHFLSVFFSRRGNAAAARGLFERASQSRGLSQGDAAQLRSNAMAILRVVR